jgi:nitrate/TMAO reductase-like tetraheme cytochrome c subunit
MSFDKAAYMKEYYQANKEELNAYHKEYMQANKEKAQAYSKEYYQANKEKIAARIKEYKLKKKYGITLKERKAMLKKQNNKCKICSVKFNENNFKSKSCVDHCHTTHKIRGLLCRSCNVGLGHFKDNTNLLTTAITYLEEAV